MKNFHLISYKVFPFDVLVTWNTTDEEVKKYLKRKYGIELSDEDSKLLSFEDTGRGRSMMLDTNQTIIRFKNKPDMGVIAHEVNHAVFFLMDRVNIKHSFDCDEIWAYLTEYLVNEIVKIFKT